MTERKPGEHPCPAPQRLKGLPEGSLWACDCGKVYVLRNEWNYAGDVWEWRETDLVIKDVTGR